MAPTWQSLLATSPDALDHVLFHRSRNLTGPSVVSDYLTAQFRNPGDILSVLLLLGPDIVQRAVAQLAGRAVTPVAFFFRLGCLCHGQLIPDADVGNTIVVDADTGHRRETKSWVLSRLLRDANNRLDSSMKGEAAHMPPMTEEDIHNPTNQLKYTHHSGPPKQAWEALRVTIYEVNKSPPCLHGVPTLDWVWYSGFVVILLQLVIATLAWALANNWGTFLVTCSGNLLAIVGGSLPQWRQEKWACPKSGGATVILTQGNGSRHAIVVIGQRKEKIGLDLEILARGTRTTQASWTTRIASAVLAFLWVILLITVSGLEENSWYLLGIGLLGSIQNLLAAGAPRDPSALGVHLTYKDVIRADRVAEVLKAAEKYRPGLGISLLDIFFPGSLRVKDEDLKFWREALRSRHAPNKYGTPVNRIPFAECPIDRIDEKASEPNDDVRF